MDHLDELKNQVNFLLSIKHKATSTLVGQITDFKTNLLQSSQQDEDASIAVIVDEIWNNYDFDHSGNLDKDELSKFVKEIMPEMRSDFEFSE